MPVRVLYTVERAACETALIAGSRVWRLPPRRIPESYSQRPERKRAAAALLPFWATQFRGLDEDRPAPRGVSKGLKKVGVVERCLALLQDDVTWAKSMGATQAAQSSGAAGI